MNINDYVNKNIDNRKAFESKLVKAFDEKDKEKLREACSEFEAIFLDMMYKQMKKTVPESSLTEKSPGREIFEEMLDDEIIKDSKQRGIGIADMMYKQLARRLEKTYKEIE